MPRPDLYRRPTTHVRRSGRAIDAGFARWDLAHLHGFELSDGRLIGIFDPEYPGEWLDETTLKVTREVKPGESFEYVFDFGDDWRHSCAVEPEKADPLEEYGATPSTPVPIWGWGRFPTSTAAAPLRSSSASDQVR